MLIAVNTLFLIPDMTGGVEVYLRCLLRALRELPSAPRLLLITNQNNHDTFSDFERVRIDLNAGNIPHRLFAEGIQISNLARRKKADVLFSPFFSGPIRPALPHLVTLHDTDFIDVPQSFIWYWLLLSRFFIPMVARKADAIATVSEYARQRIVDAIGIDSRRIIVTPNAPDDIFYRPHPCPPIRKPFLLFVGFIYLHKNLERLTRSFLSIVDSIPHDLVIVGRIRRYLPMRHPRIHHFQHVSQEDLVGLYQGADLLVFPSLCEGFGIPVIEAMAAGTRVVASTAPAVLEVAYGAATHFDPYDEKAIACAILDALAEAPEQRDAWIKAGRARARQFTWAHCARRTMQAMELAVKEFTRRRS